VMEMSSKWFRAAITRARCSSETQTLMAARLRLVLAGGPEGKEEGPVGETTDSFKSTYLK